MRPIEWIRADPDGVRSMLEARRFDAPLDRIIELDTTVRRLKGESESLRAERNRASRGGPPDDAIKARMREVGDRVREIETELSAAEAELQGHTLWIPNRIDPAVPDGDDEGGNRVVRQDQPRERTEAVRPHWEVGEALGILDIPRGTRLSGSCFYVLRGAGAALKRALIAWMIDLKLPHGFVEIYPPFVTRRETRAVDR